MTVPELVAKFVVPLKVAVIVWTPTASVDVVKVAWPEPLRATFDASVRRALAERHRPAVTGLPPPVTVAVNVTVWPNVDGLGDEASAVVVADLIDGLGDCAGARSRTFVVPLKVAVIVWAPTASVDVVNVAWPEALRATFDASVVAPSLNVTVPSVTGLPPPVTVAVNVTAWPNVDGLGDEAIAVVVARSTWAVATAAGINVNTNTEMTRQPASPSPHTRTSRFTSTHDHRARLAQRVESISIPYLARPPPWSADPDATPAN